MPLSVPISDTSIDSDTLLCIAPFIPGATLIKKVHWAQVLVAERQLRIENDRDSERKLSLESGVPRSSPGPPTDEVCDSGQSHLGFLIWQTRGQDSAVSKPPYSCHIFIPMAWKS